MNFVESQMPRFGVTSNGKAPEEVVELRFHFLSKG